LHIRIEADMRKHMRTTVEINDALARRVKSLIAKRKTTFRNIVEEALTRLLEEEGKNERGFTLRDASVGGDGPTEEAHDLTWEVFSRHLYRRP
jgi:predicted transcriptional regulator